MKLSYSEQEDAAYVEVVGPIEPGGVDSMDELDQDRNVDFDVDGRIIGYEFLNVRRYGVRLDDLAHRDKLRALFHEAGFAERDWSAQRPALRRAGPRPMTG